MNFLLYQKYESRTEDLAQRRFFLRSGIYQIYKEKCNFLAAPVIEIVNQIFFVSQKCPKV